jgi:enoyl-CoA hydratase/carnithine racemase
MADWLEWGEQDGARVLWLRRGKGNALSPQFLEQLAAALEPLPPAPPRGLILSAAGSVFCAGLDLVQLLELDRAGMARTVEGLYRVGRALFALPCPVVAAIQGHAVAGGAYLALCCDLRLMASGAHRFGLNESRLGLSMPAHCIEVVRYALTASIVERALYGGELYPAPQALELGLVDELVDADALLAQAAARIAQWSANSAAFADIKRRLKQPALCAMDAARSADEQWLDLWFSQPAQARLHAAREQLQKGKRA